jgi:hypothetical protein
MSSTDSNTFQTDVDSYLRLVPSTDSNTFQRDVDSDLRLRKNGDFNGELLVGTTDVPSRFDKIDNSTKLKRVRRGRWVGDTEKYGKDPHAHALEDQFSEYAIEDSWTYIVDDRKDPQGPGPGAVPSLIQSKYHSSKWHYRIHFLLQLLLLWETFLLKVLLLTHHLHYKNVEFETIQFFKQIRESAVNYWLLYWGKFSERMRQEMNIMTLGLAEKLDLVDFHRNMFACDGETDLANLFGCDPGEKALSREERLKFGEDLANIFDDDGPAKDSKGNTNANADTNSAKFLKHPVSSVTKTVTDIEHKVADTVVSIEHKIADKVGSIEHKIVDKVVSIEHKISDKVASIEHNISDKVASVTHKISDQYHIFQSESSEDFMILASSSFIIFFGGLMVLYALVRVVRSTLNLVRGVKRACGCRSRKAEAVKTNWKGVEIANYGLSPRGEIVDHGYSDEDSEADSENMYHHSESNTKYHHSHFHARFYFLINLLLFWETLFLIILIFTHHLHMVNIEYEVTQAAIAMRDYCYAMPFAVPVFIWNQIASKITEQLLIVGRQLRLVPKMMGADYLSHLCEDGNTDLGNIFGCGKDSEGSLGSDLSIDLANFFGIAGGSLGSTLGGSEGVSQHYSGGGSGDSNNEWRMR